MVFAQFNPVSLTFITAAGRSVKIWDALTGRLQAEYHSLTEADSAITAVCLDERQRRFLVGDQSGRISLYNYSSGALMHTVHQHKYAITSLHYLPSETLGVKENLILAASGPELSVHREEEVKNSLVNRLLEAKSYDVTAVATSRPLNVIAIGYGDGSVMIQPWALVGSHIRKLTAADAFKNPITAITFLLHHPMLVVAEQSGAMTVVYIGHGCLEKVSHPWIVVV